MRVSSHFPSWVTLIAFLSSVYVESPLVMGDSPEPPVAGTGDDTKALFKTLNGGIFNNEDMVIHFRLEDESSQEDGWIAIDESALTHDISQALGSGTSASEKPESRENKVDKPGIACRLCKRGRLLLQGSGCSKPLTMEDLQDSAVTFEDTSLVEELALKLQKISLTSQEHVIQDTRERIVRMLGMAPFDMESMKVDELLVVE